MKVPENIKKSIRMSSYHKAIANRENQKIREWLHKNNIHNDGVLDMLIDSTELSNSPEAFIGFLENNSEKYEFKGNSGYEDDY